MGEDRAARNEIVGIAEGGLALKIDGREEVAPWSAILAVDAVLALVDQTGNQRIPVLVLEISAKADELTFIVAESEPLWEPLILVLPEVLPRAASVETWNRELKTSGMAQIYERTAGLQ